jgi:hypothetical protein
VYWLDPQAHTTGDVPVMEAPAASGAGAAASWLAALSHPITFFAPYPGAVTGTGQIARVQHAGSSWKDDGAWMSLIVAAGTDSTPAGTRSKAVLVQRRPAPLAR